MELPRELRIYRWFLKIAVGCGGGIPSGSQSFHVYAQSLFPECNEQEVTNMLTGRVVIDIGSGLNHKNPYSLINVLALKARVIGIEPRIGYLAGSKQGFSRRNLIGEKIRLEIEQTIRRFTGRIVRKDVPGECNIIATVAEKLPFADGSVDIALSHFLILYWIVDPVSLLPIFEELLRVLRISGQIRVSLSSSGHRFFEDYSSEVGQLLKNRFTTTLLRREGTAILTKLA